MQIPFFRPLITEAEIAEVIDCLHSGWLTTGPRVEKFENAFAAQVGSKNAIALNSCTAALHLAVEALGLRSGQAVLVPTMTFAATAEIVRYMGAIPLLVDCDPVTMNMDLNDAERKIAQLWAGETPLARGLRVAGIIPVHVGGLMLDMDELQSFATRHGLWMIEDAAHALPAAYRRGADQPWRRCGERTAAVSCFSFYANKTMTTGEGGMAVTDDQALAERMRQMSLHGLSHDAWRRYAGAFAWDYQIVAPGYKYNMTDIAAGMGIHQLGHAECSRIERAAVAQFYRERLADVEEVELPPDPPDRVHSWHLFPIRLNLDRLSIDRNTFMIQLRERGVGCSVHWRPLHLHPYYSRTFGWLPNHFPAASAQWRRLISLPLFPGMRDDERNYVVESIRAICAARRRAPTAAASGTPQDCRALAARIRLHAVKMTHRSGSSHVGTSLSMAEILGVLYGRVLRVRPEAPDDPDRDRLILSKGHGAAALYAVLAECGFFPRDWLDGFCVNGGRLFGHATLDGVPGVDASTGSLGHGLSLACGAALAGKRDGRNYRVFTVLSDGECDEGSTWEAVLFAPHHQLDNLVAIVDYNKIQSLGRVKDVLDLDPFAAKWQAFRWATREVDGHDVDALVQLLADVPFEPGKPSCLIAHTVKGKGVSFMEDDLLWHYRSPQGEEYQRALAELEGRA